MHIRYGDKGYEVDYIQGFLKENYSDSVIISGIYDKSTHNSLVKYLELPEVVGIADMCSTIIQRYNILNYFSYSRTNTTIIFKSNSADSSTAEFMSNIYQDFKRLVDESGWKIDDYSNYLNSDVENFVISISKARENKIPSRELLSMVNKFDGTFFYDFFLDGDNSQISYSVGCGYKLAMIPCKPNTKYTITHGYSDIIQMGICSYTYSSIENMNKIYSYKSVYVEKGKYCVYKTSENAKYIVIQVPNVSLSHTNYTVNLLLGDVNLDNKLDESDINIMQDCLSGRSQVQSDYFQLYDTNKDRIFNSSDLTRLREMVSNHTEEYVTKEVTLDQNKSENVIFVIEGTDIESNNIPISDYNSETWMVHEKFIEYILRITIDKYGKPDDITYLHNLVKGNVSIASLGQSGEYTEILKEAVRNFQKRNNIPYCLGYLDTETEKLMLESGA